MTALRGETDACTTGDDDGKGASTFRIMDDEDGGRIEAGFGNDVNAGDANGVADAAFDLGVSPRCKVAEVDWISILLGVRDDDVDGRTTLLACWLFVADIGAAVTITDLAIGVGAENENSGELGANDPSASSLGTASNEANVLSPSEDPIIISTDDSRLWLTE